jgi:hypothetical protein
MKQFLAGTAIILAVATLHGSVALADQVLTYTGRDFEFVDGPYTKMDFVSGTIDLSADLPADCVDCVVMPVSFSFTDGVQTLTDANATGSDFEFWTNPFGQIIHWNVDISAPLQSFIESQNELGVGSGDEGQDGYGIDGSNDLSGKFTNGFVPEPSPLAIMGTVLVALGFGSLRRRRKIAPYTAA